MTITFLSALEKALVDLHQPIVSDYTLFLCAHRIDALGKYKEQSIYKQKNPLSREKGLRFLRELQERHVIKKDKNFKSSIYRINEVADRTAEEVCSLADPFCYVSHFSAMTRYGLTNRIPSAVILTTPAPEVWKNLRDKLVLSDYGKIPHHSSFTPLKQVGFSEQVRGVQVVRLMTKYPAETTLIKDSFVRMASIGEVFVDTLSHPGLCGGMEHVLEVWREHAPIYLDEIIASVNRFPKKIVKVRAGYILDELLNLKDERIDVWLEATQRGGSQVLNPEWAFQPTFSEKWMLSLNV